MKYLTQKWHLESFGPAYLLITVPADGLAPSRPSAATMLTKSYTYFPDILLNDSQYNLAGSLLLTWTDFNPSMDNK